MTVNTGKKALELIFKTAKNHDLDNIKIVFAGGEWPGLAVKCYHTQLPMASRSLVNILFKNSGFSIVRAQKMIELVTAAVQIGDSRA